MASVNDHRYMTRALELAAKGHRQTSPNPMVGAVLVRHNKVIGEGYHRAAGSAHAEIIALKKAGKQARGATLYVTLEPCCHTGRTGPCTKAIIKSGISRVVYACKDPDPRVQGKGASELRHAGVKVTNGILKQETIDLNEDYFSFHQHGRPFITVKTAQTLDGKIATSTGDSRWITSKPSRVFAHRQRANVDAIVVGSGTVKKDNPALTVRHVRGRDPYRIILSASLNFPLTSRLLADNEDYRTIVATSDESARKLSRKPLTRMPIVWSLKTNKSGLIDLDDFVQRATDFGFRSLLVEGGSRIISSFLSVGLVDKIVSIVAPKLLGTGLDAFGELGIRKIDAAVCLHRCTVQTSGQDIVVTGYPLSRK